MYICCFPIYWDVAGLISSSFIDGKKNWLLGIKSKTKFKLLLSGHECHKTSTSPTHSPGRKTWLPIFFFFSNKKPKGSQVSTECLSPLWTQVWPLQKKFLHLRTSRLPILMGQTTNREKKNLCLRSCLKHKKIGGKQVNILIIQTKRFWLCCCSFCSLKNCFICRPVMFFFGDCTDTKVLDHIPEVFVALNKFFFSDRSCFFSATVQLSPGVYLKGEGQGNILRPVMIIFGHLLYTTQQSGGCCTILEVPFHICQGTVHMPGWCHLQLP